MSDRTEITQYHLIRTRGSTVDATWNSDWDTMIELSSEGGESISVEIEDLYDVLTEIRKAISDGR